MCSEGTVEVGRNQSQLRTNVSPIQTHFLTTKYAISETLKKIKKINSDANLIDEIRGRII